MNLIITFVFFSDGATNRFCAIFEMYVQYCVGARPAHSRAANAARGGAYACRLVACTVHRARTQAALVGTAADLSFWLVARWKIAKGSYSTVRTSMQSLQGVAMHAV